VKVAEIAKKRRSPEAGRKRQILCSCHRGSKSEEGKRRWQHLRFRLQDASRGTQVDSHPDSRLTITFFLASRAWRKVVEKCRRAGPLREPRFHPAWQYNLSKTDIQQWLPVKVAKAVTLCRGYPPPNDRCPMGKEFTSSLRKPRLSSSLL
jgi:hypothetical protein